MERGHTFVDQEYYHVFSRGVEKREIFVDSGDWERFLVLLALSNGNSAVRTSDIVKVSRGLPSRIWEEVSRFTGNNSSSRLVDVIAYTLMPNHFHVFVRNRGDSGVSRFMSKLMTGYSMYFNTKNQRSGPLFVHPFRSRHVDTDEYARWLFAYIHLNPLSRAGSPLSSQQSINSQDSSYLQNYRFSSFADYFGPARLESLIIDKHASPFDIGTLNTSEDLLQLLSSHEMTSDSSNYLKESLV